ncbi:pali-domain-containing protein [Hyaloscypha hepaticicola]|uniref:Pali-domain-containing protein n=1 Tax=Hyaloscypha hepaticicola TaxID=2082293 RepID=A0A2J6PNI6_9HELO|nr:pali-domain-containing protein [Hyaloscypha hepaticicola]
MAKTGIFHHVGTFLLFAAAILLLITTISAPVIGDIAILKVMLTNKTDIRNSSVTFGTFGHCVLDVAPVQTDQDYCYPKHIGYNPADIMTTIDHTTFSTAAEDSSKALTRVMILHPIACALAFIAFLFALGAGFCGAIFASMIAAVAWLVTLVVMVTDFVLFGIIKRHVNSDGSGSHAYYSVGMWTILAAMILLFIATFIVLFTCCSSRMHRNNRTSKETGYNGTTTTRRHFWQRRNRY